MQYSGLNCRVPQDQVEEWSFLNEMEGVESFCCIHLHHYNKQWLSHGNEEPDFLYTGKQRTNIVLFINANI